MSELYGGIEAGGTKFVCGVGTGPEDLRAELRFATTTPEETLGQAIERRWGRRAEELPEDHPAWELEALYLARMAMNLVTTLSPRRIVLGGGVMQQARLLPAIRRRLRELLAGYVQSPAILDRVDAYVVAPELGTRAGLLGALALAQVR